MLGRLAVLTGLAIGFHSHASQMGRYTDAANHNRTISYDCCASFFAICIIWRGCYLNLHRGLRQGRGIPFARRHSAEYGWVQSLTEFQSGTAFAPTAIERLSAIFYSTSRILRMLSAGIPAAARLRNIWHQRIEFNSASPVSLTIFFDGHFHRGPVEWVPVTLGCRVPNGHAGGNSARLLSSS